MSFSIITPSRNNSTWLKLCVASVADQGVPVEHIVQDAGSSDGTSDWLPSDPRIRAFVEPDAGMYDALNRGLRRATGEIFAHLNSDEQYLPGVLLAVERFFAAHPAVDIVFGDVVYVDTAGQYLYHRKMLVPQLYHTWVCHLSTLSCGMFLRRRLIEPGAFFFNPQYRVVGDAEWMVRLLKAGVRMATLRQFTSIFTQTGANLSRGPRAVQEWRQLRASAPWWARVGSPGIVLHHRLRRLLGGVYSQAPFEFSIFTAASPGVRMRRRVDRPTCRCPR